MGQKVSPLLMRIGYIKKWRSTWFADKRDFATNILEDYKIRKFIRKKFVQAAVARIDIERTDKVKIIIHTARPGVIIGRRGADIDKLKAELGNMVTREIAIEPREVKSASSNAQLIAQNVTFQLEKRVAFRRAVKRSIDQAMQSGSVKGIKISVAGRLNGAEMSRRETYKEGKLPLHTLRADVDYGFAEALTTYGILGVKVWVYKGDILVDRKKQNQSPVAQKAVPAAEPAPAK